VALSKEQLHDLARLGAKARLEELRAEIAALEALVGTSRAGRRARRTVVADRIGRKRPTISPEGRARIAAAQKKRWAAVKRAKAQKA